jgi:SAM-dependent methyltransferase
MRFLDECLAQGDPAIPLRVEIMGSGLPAAPQPLGWWLRVADARPPHDITALDWVRAGRVLDVGCCTGRELGILARRGLDVHGLDMLPNAVALARRNGISCDLQDVYTYAPEQPIDNVLLMGGNGGLPGTLDKLPGFLRLLATWLAPGGSIVFSSSDWKLFPPKGPQDAAVGHASATSPGEVLMRLRIDEHCDDWFPWLLVSPDQLTDACRQAGLGVSQITYWSGTPAYSAMLTPVEDAQPCL